MVDRRWPRGLAVQRIAAGAGANRAAGRCRCRADHLCGGADRLAVDSRTGAPAAHPGKLQLHHQLIARHCRGTGAGHRAGGYRPSPGGAGKHGAQPWPLAGPGTVADHNAPGGAGRRCGSGTGVPRDHQRTDRHPVARAERHAHPGHRVLGDDQRNRLRRSGALRVDHDSALTAVDRPPLPPIQTHGRPMNALELTALCKTFGTQQALADVSLAVPNGSRMVIVGPSGSGKTTLLRMIAGFEFPDSGSLTLNGQVLVDATHAVPAHQRQIGYVPQDGALFPHMTVADNIGFGLAAKHASRHARIAELMDSVALDANMARRWPHELSGGQQQRVALARALAQQPRLMLLDEPFSALDTGLRSAMRKMVARLLSDAGITTILVTHDQSEALSFADQLAVMRQGRLVQSGRPMDLYQYPVDEQTALFLGEAVVLPARI